jgi:hypothetical protein
MLAFLTIVIMLAVAYAEFREGIFTSFAMLVNVVIAGVITFNFYEPLTSLTDSVVQGTFLDGYQDWFFLMLLFCLTLGLLRMATNNLTNQQIDFPAMANQFGGGVIGLLTGYLVAGFLLCVVATLPMHQNFMGFYVRSASDAGFARYFPADRAWLSVMRHAGAYPFSRDPDNEGAESPYDSHPTFDRSGTFELRYYRYRRYSDTEGPLPYQGELNEELKR